jgi:hypothetical protein
MKKYLASYDRFNQFLSLDTRTGKSQIEEYAKPPAAQLKLRGLFVEEAGLPVGMYASGEGPVVFLATIISFAALGKPLRVPKRSQRADEASFSFMMGKRLSRRLISRAQAWA